MAIKQLSLGDMLIAEGVTTPERRDDAPEDQKRVGKRLAEALFLAPGVFLALRDVISAFKR